MKVVTVLKWLKEFFLQKCLKVDRVTSKGASKKKHQILIINGQLEKIKNKNEKGYELFIGNKTKYERDPNSNVKQCTRRT